MRYIAHRGLIDGPNINIENHPDALEKSWRYEYDCEIDVWVLGNKIVLGHDGPQYEVSKQFIVDNASKSWYHCKNFGALNFFSDQRFMGFNYFWHEEDSFTLTSYGYIWTYPNKKNELGDLSICVLPELYMPFDSSRDIECAGICSDYIGVIRMLRGDI